MTNKDLNLELNQQLTHDNKADHDGAYKATAHQTAAAQQQATQKREPHFDDKMNAVEPPQESKQQPNPFSSNPFNTPPPSSTLSTSKKHQFPWLITSVFCIVLVFILLASFWFFTPSNSSSSSLASVPPSATQPPPIKPASSIDNQEINALKKQLITLQSSVEQLESTIQEQKRLIVAHSKEMSDQIQQLDSRLTIIQTPTVTQTPTPKKEKAQPPKKQPSETNAVAKTPTQEKTKPEKKQPSNQWYLNIGTFSSKDAATRLKQQLLTLGHYVQMDAISFDNKPAYRLQLPGFKNREDAETTARKIMEKTNLNGLWARQEQ